ncbi:MAG TPA: hypothetical protein VGP41_11540 [Candidatus Lustribacter sp.]|jgi:hypothetical protein|nr:hypothetical protein [Candidatus Lustribacter sp.]
MKRTLTIALALSFLTACGGGGGSTTPPATQTASQSAKTSSGSVTLSIPLAGATQSSAKVRFPQFVSPNADSVALVINGGTPQIFDVSPTSTLCVTGATARTCTLKFGAPVGSDIFDFLIYQNPNAQGALLASTQTTQTIAAGTAFNFVVAMNAVIGTVVANVPSNGGTQGNCPDGAMSFNGVSEGCAGSSGTITFTVYDPSGATITGTTPFVSPIVITTGDPSVTANPSQITAPGQTAVLTYTGAPLGAAITNSIAVNLTIGNVVIPASVPARRSYLYVANSDAPAGTTPANGGNIAVYAFGATGNATPVRVIANGATTQLYTPETPLLDSSGNLYVLDNGQYITQAVPVVNVYAADVNGNVAPIRQITGIGALDGNAACESMVFDPTGNYLLVLCDDATIFVFPATGNGAASSLMTAHLGSDFFTSPVSMAFDALGNLYVTDPANNSGMGSIDYFPAAQVTPTVSTCCMSPTVETSSPTGWPSAASVAPLGIGVDQQGTLYASIAYAVPAPGGANDADNQIAMWNTTQIPCNCVPSRTLTGLPLTNHAPAGMALDPPGNLYVSNPFNNTVYVFSHATVGTGGSGPAVLHSITVTASGSSSPVGMVVGP